MAATQKLPLDFGLMAITEEGNVIFGTYLHII
jgi:hypothetical protein